MTAMTIPNKHEIPSDERARMPSGAIIYLPADVELPDGYRMGAHTHRNDDWYVVRHDGAYLVASLRPDFAMAADDDHPEVHEMTREDIADALTGAEWTVPGPTEPKLEAE